jgi:hypothetical protein
MNIEDFDLQLFADPKNLAASINDATARAAALMTPEGAGEIEEDEGLEPVVERTEPPAAAVVAAPGEPVQAAITAPKPAAASVEAQPDAPPVAAVPVVATPVVAADPWAETEDIEYEDADTGEKFTVRAPKTYAERVKGGYQRRSLMDRKLMGLGKNRAWLEPLLERGELDTLAPYITAAQSDPALGEAFAKILTRKQLGLPLLEAAQAEAAAAGAAAAAPQPAAPAPAAFDADKFRASLVAKGYDDYTAQAMAEGMSEVAGPILQAASEAQRQAAEAKQYYSTFQDQQKSAQDAQARAQQIAIASRDALLQHFPDTLSVRTPPETFQRIHQYAESSGLIQRYGLSPLTYVEAYRAMQSTMGAFGTTAPSPAAAALAQADRVEAQGKALAAQAAQGVTRATAPGSASPVITPQPAKRKQIPRYRVAANGQKIPLNPTEVAALMAAS